MRRTLSALALGATMMVAPMLVPAAEADHSDWVFGASFRIGGAHFDIGYLPTVHAPAYYYRTRAPLQYHGHRCHDRCYHRAGYSYHYASCPLVQRHFRHYRYEPRTVFARYAPTYRGGYYDRYDRYDRHDRYDRRHDRRHYDRGRDLRHHDRRHFDRDRGRHDDRRHFDRDRRDRDRRHRYDRDRDRGFRRGDDDDRGRHGRRDRGRGHHRDRHRHDD